MNQVSFAYFLEVWSERVTENVKEDIKGAEFSLLGALYFDKIVRKFKNFLQFLSDKPVTKLSLELTEIS
jgi:hypothetical protein